ncbi:hypothetical protein [Labilibaculum antarcticum]|uniref:hypothetical protein n=1 Tax=Labilibaculum antarcticum TaxID=1717717 RepID=UPI001293EFE7|nr:hypothetical protein [Labilibaculum antarcticum]
MIRTLCLAYTTSDLSEKSIELNKEILDNHLGSNTQSGERLLTEAVSDEMIKS